MFKKIFMHSLLVLALSIGFLGCSTKGMQTDDSFDGKTEVIKAFQTGTVIKVQKVLINDRKTATLTGAGIGAMGGLITKVNNESAKSIAIGAAIGGIVGAIIGNEIEAYQTTILSNDYSYVVYLKYKLSIDSKVEFVLRDDNKISHVNLLKSGY